LSALASETREGSRGARVRVGVGAGVILLLVALVVAVVVTTVAPRGGVRDLGVGSTGTASPSSGAVVGDARASQGPPTTASVLLVHVLGAVAKPGIVELRPGSRVVDAIASAGGLAADANAGGVNLARPVSDGEQIVVPREGESVAPAAAGPAPGGAIAGSLVNVNAASAAELQALPRIGPALAQRIVDWREANGRFAAAADLMKVSGIGQTLFDAFKDLIVV
jgi:competence protein ComEA